MFTFQKLKHISSEKARIIALSLSLIYVISIFTMLHRAQPLNSVPHFTVTGFESSPKEEAIVTSLFRGNNERTGSFSVPADIKNAHVAWATEDLFADIHSASKSTPAVDATGIYFGTDLGIFYRYSLEGKKIWSFKVDGGTQGIHGTALLDEKYVYFGSYAGNFYCLEKSSGKLIWTTTVAHAVGSSPLINGELIIAAAEFSKPHEGYVVAINKFTGKVKWTSAFFGEQVHSSPALSPENGILGVGSNANTFFGIDSFTGEIAWQIPTAGPIKGTPAVFKDAFLFTSWDKNLYVVSNTGHLRQRINIDGTSQSSPAIDVPAGRAYVTSSSGNLYKIDLDKSEPVQAVSLINGGINKMSMPSPIVLQSSHRSWVVSSCFGDSVCIFETRHMKLLKRVPVGGLVSGSFAVWDSSLFANVNNKGLVRIDLN